MTGRILPILQQAGGIGRLTRRLVTAFLLVLPWMCGAAPRSLEVAPGVYAMVGELNEVTRANRGVVGNAGFIVGTDGVIVIDSGPSARYGQILLAEVRRRTCKPVRLLVLTHAVQEFIFGASAFVKIGVPVLAHVDSAQLMRTRCAHCLENLVRQLGKREMRGSRVVTADILVHGGTRLTISGRDIELVHHGWAASPGDIAVFDRATGVLFAGAMVAQDRIPSLRDAEVTNWIQALQKLKAMPITRVVPAHGPVADPRSIDSTEQYLQSLLDATRLRFESGATLVDSMQQLELPAFRQWALYPTLHPQNVQRVYLKLERDDFDAK